MMAITDPGKSWAAKWHHVSKGVPGVYAMTVPQHVFDQLPEEARSLVRAATVVLGNELVLLSHRRSGRSSKTRNSQAVISVW